MTIHFRDVNRLKKVQNPSPAVCDSKHIHLPLSIQINLCLKLDR